MSDTKVKKDKGILTGSLWRAILIFALPIAAGNMLQQLFNTADVAIVGKFAGKEALAAVGSNGPIINHLLNLFIGISVGANVVIARYIGEGNSDRVRKATHTAVVVAFFSGIIVMLLGLVLARPMLEWMNSPEDVIDLASLYLKIYFMGMPFMMVYNFSAAILRSRGDTKRPLVALALSGVINVILNLFFVIVLHMSVAGVALATVIANGVSAAMLIWFLLHEEGDLKLDFKLLKIDGRILAEFARIGIPSGLQGAVFSASNLFVQSSLNSLGSDYMAGSSAALNFEFYVYHLMSGFSQATVTFNGQNYGAGNYRRCRSVTKWCLFLGIGFGSVLITALMLLRSSMVYIFTDDTTVAQIAILRMMYILPFIMVNSTSDILSGSMRGVGHSMVPAVITIAGVCGVRLIWIYTVFEKIKTFDILMMIYPVSWVITAVGIIAAYFVVRKKELLR
ncbi:MAG: MATE family efflux transporter [Clostridia bacterium]|nr:MATE family efflux transporter [Clostridia bacterium]